MVRRREVYTFDENACLDKRVNDAVGWWKIAKKVGDGLVVSGKKGGVIFKSWRWVMFVGGGGASCVKLKKDGSGLVVFGICGWMNIEVVMVGCFMIYGCVLVCTRWSKIGLTKGNPGSSAMRLAVGFTLG